MSVNTPHDIPSGWQYAHGDIQVLHLFVHGAEAQSEQPDGSVISLGDIVTVDVVGLVQVPDEEDIETTIRLHIRPDTANEAGAQLVRCAFNPRAYDCRTAGHPNHDQEGEPS